MCRKGFLPHPALVRGEHFGQRFPIDTALFWAWWPSPSCVLSSEWGCWAAFSAAGTFPGPGSRRPGWKTGIGLEKGSFMCPCGGVELGQQLWNRKQQQSSSYDSRAMQGTPEPPELHWGLQHTLHCCSLLSWPFQESMCRKTAINFHFSTHKTLLLTAVLLIPGECEWCRKTTVKFPKTLCNQEYISRNTGKF